MYIRFSFQLGLLCVGPLEPWLLLHWSDTMIMLNEAVLELRYGCAWLLSRV